MIHRALRYLLMIPAVLILLNSCTPVPEGIIYVKKDSEPRGEGNSWKAAFRTVQEALDKAVPGNEIWVAAGTYTPTAKVGGSKDRHKSFHLKSGVKLLGGFKGTETMRRQRDWKNNKTILSGDITGDDEGSRNRGNNAYHVVTGNQTDSSAVLDGFTITGGNANHDSWPDDGGGGMNNHDGSPTIRNCMFVDNAAFADGGGIRNWGESSMPYITYCTFINNSVQQEGGGMMNGPGSRPTVLYCKFFGNYAGEDGGGMYINESFGALIANCVFTQNSSGLTGGAVYTVNGSTPDIINCSFSLNSAKKAGGCIANNGGNPNITNCVLWNNSAPSKNEISNIGDSNPVIRYCSISDGYEGEGNISGDPLFADQELRLSGESHCIDAGDNDSLPANITTDYEGNKRLVGRFIDMGAFEFKPSEQ